MTGNISWKIKAFCELTIDELYAILYLRCKVFEVEQNCSYLDTDYKDQKALHLMGYIDNKLITYCRLFKPFDYFNEASIGRVVCDADYRHMGYGHQLMEKAIVTLRDRWDETIITISAQLYLKQFYESHGFKQNSDTYLEDNILHVRMCRNVY